MPTQTPEGGEARTDAAPPSGLPLASGGALAGFPGQASASAYTPPTVRGPFLRYFNEHPRVVDGIVIFGALLLGIFTVIESTVDGRWWVGLLLVLQCGALWFRRDRPWAVLAVVVVIDAAALFSSAHSSSAGAGAWFALYAVATTSSARRSLLAAAGSSIPAVAYFFFWYSPVGGWGEIPQLFTYVVAVSWLLCNLLAVGLGVLVRNNREHQGELRAWAMRRADYASVQERNRIAREMHDVVSHSLTVMVALSDGASRIVERDAGRAQEVLSELSQTGRTALADMRRVLGVLREEGQEAASRAPSPGLDGLQTMVGGFRSAGLPVTLSLSGAPLPADAAFQLAVYRIVQESLTNTLRYGRGMGSVTVALAHEGRRVRISVENDGAPAGGAVKESMGLGRGLSGMRERAAIYGGTVHSGPRPFGGWLVEAELFWDEGN